MKKLLLTLLLFISSLLAVDRPVYHLTHPYAFSKNHDVGLEQLKNVSRAFEKLHPFEYSHVPIDIFIPCIERDLPILEYTLTFARRNILHPIQNVYICAPSSEKILQFCQQHNCIFVDETIIAPIQIADIPYFPGGSDRRSWLFQQFLKLNSDAVCTSEHILILDSETILLRPQAFVYNNLTILNCANEHHPPYFGAYERLLGEKPASPFSFVSHHMLMQKSKLRDLKERIQFLHNKSWYLAIIDSMDKNDTSGFSEYETYGNFFISHYPNEFILLHFFNIGSPRDRLPALNDINFNMGNEIKSVSFHWYLN